MCTSTFLKVQTRVADFLLLLVFSSRLFSDLVAHLTSIHTHTQTVNDTSVREDRRKFLVST